MENRVSVHPSRSRRAADTFSQNLTRLNNTGTHFFRSTELLKDLTGLLYSSSQALDTSVLPDYKYTFLSTPLSREFITRSHDFSLPFAARCGCSSRRYFPWSSNGDAGSRIRDGETSDNQRSAKQISASRRNFIVVSRRLAKVVTILVRLRRNRDL